MTDKSYVVEGVPGGVLRALFRHASDTRGRYYYDCIRVDGRHMIATDMTTFAVVTLPESLGEAGLFEIHEGGHPLLKREPARINRMGETILIEQEDRRVKLVQNTDDKDYDTWPKDGDEDYLPDEYVGAEFCVDIARLRKTLDVLDGAGHSRVRFTVPPDPKLLGKPIRVDGYKNVANTQHGAPNREDPAPEGVKASIAIAPVISQDEKERRKQ